MGWTVAFPVSIQCVLSLMRSDTEGCPTTQRDAKRLTEQKITAEGEEGGTGGGENQEKTKEDLRQQSQSKERNWSFNLWSLHGRVPPMGNTKGNKHEENASGKLNRKTEIENARGTIKWKIPEAFHERLDSWQQWSEASSTATNWRIDKENDRRFDGRIDGRID